MKKPEKDKRLIAFKRDGDICSDLAYKKVEDGDLFGALSLLKQAKELQPHNAFIDLDIADIYDEMGLNDYTVSYLFQAMNQKSREAEKEATVRLAEFFWYAGDVNASTVYMQKAMQKWGGDVPYSEEFTASLMESTGGGEPSPLSYRLTYPPESVDFSPTILYGRTLMKDENFSRAIEVLSQIPETAGKYYTEALANRALAYYLSGEDDLAEADARKALAVDPDNVFAACNLVSVLTNQGRREEAGEVVSSLKKIQTDNVEDMLKIATAYCEFDEHEAAKNMLRRVTEYQPYDMTVLYLLAVACYNLGEDEEALSVLSDIRVVADYNPTVDYLTELCRAGGKKKREPIPYAFQIPAEAVKKCQKKFTDFCKKNPAERAKYIKNTPDWKSAVSWVNYTNDFTLQTLTIETLAETPAKPAEDYLKRELILPGTPDRIRREVVYHLLLTPGRKRTGYVRRNVFMRVDLIPLENCPAAEEEAIRCAYARAVTSMLFMGEDDLCDRLLTAADHLYYALQMKGKFSLLFKYDERVFAAYLYSVGDFHENAALSVSKVFGAKPAELRALKEELEE